MNLKHKQNKTRSIISSLLAIFHGVAFYMLLVLLVAGSLFGFKVYSQEQKMQVQVRGTKDVVKGSSITICFSSKMLKKTVQDNMAVEPKLDMQITWSSDSEIELIPTQHLHPQTDYKIKINGAKTKWRVSQDDFEISFSSPPFPLIKKIYPSNGQENIDYYEKIMIEFDRSIRDEYIMDVKIKPLTGFEYSYNENKTQLVIAPKTSLEKSTEYTIAIYLKHRYFPDINKLLYSGAFTTKQPPTVVYNFDKNGNPLKTEERREDIVPQIKEGRCIEIDISSQSLFIFQDSEEIGAYKISTGKRGMDTPSGTYKIIAKSRRPWSAKYKLYMPWFMQFTYEGHGIHELPEWPGGYKEGANHLGIPVSHGCVRLGVGPAKVVYDFVETGTPVVIHR
ncbi:MAG: L,D-transpeptidase family protein [Patescibacteria group bacterium]|nr:L,D-transpeptidase family protein [Patescibacteria group bacterium]